MRPDRPKRQSSGPRHIGDVLPDVVDEVARRAIAKNLSTANCSNDNDGAVRAFQQIEIDRAAEFDAAERELADAAEELRRAQDARYRQAASEFEEAPCSANWLRYVRAKAMWSVTHRSRGGHEDAR